MNSQFTMFMIEKSMASWVKNGGGPMPSARLICAKGPKSGP
jgi:hypothetical protein